MLETIKQLKNVVDKLLETKEITGINVYQYARTDPLEIHVGRLEIVEMLALMNNSELLLEKLEGFEGQSYPGKLYSIIHGFKVFQLLDPSEYEYWQDRLQSKKRLQSNKNCPSDVGASTEANENLIT